MPFFRIKTQKADINLEKSSTARMTGRAQRVSDILKKDPKHPKAKALKHELASILKEMGAREHAVQEVLDKLNG